MRSFTKNMGYFLKEIKTIFLLNGFSSLLSLLSLILIFFVVMLAISGWWISTDLVQAIRNEAEISVYYEEATDVDGLKNDLKTISGVKEVISIKAEQALDKMTEILGDDAKVLANFEENPFEAYFEVQIELEQLDSIIEQVKLIDGVDYVRDNQTVLTKLSFIANIVTALGVIIAVAVSIATFIITSHIIREGVHSHRAQINTLKLLGAPEWFVNLPFICEGVLLTFISGVISTSLFYVFTLQLNEKVFGSVGFLSAMDISWSLNKIVIGMLLTSTMMGLIASFFGLKMVEVK